MNILEFTPETEVLTRAEAAKLLRVSQPVFDRLYKGDSPKLAGIIDGRTIRFRRSDVMALFDKASSA